MKKKKAALGFMPDGLLLSVPARSRFPKNEWLWSPRLKHACVKASVQNGSLGLIVIKEISSYWGDGRSFISSAYSAERLVACLSSYGAFMTVRITSEEPNVFPVVEDVDARDNGTTAAIFLGTRVEGQFVTVTINLTYEQAGDLAGLLKAFANLNN